MSYKENAKKILENEKMPMDSRITALFVYSNDYIEKLDIGYKDKISFYKYLMLQVKANRLYVLMCVEKISSLYFANDDVNGVFECLYATQIISGIALKETPDILENPLFLKEMMKVQQMYGFALIGKGKQKEGAQAISQALELAKRGNRFGFDFRNEEKILSDCIANLQGGDQT